MYSHTYDCVIYSLRSRAFCNLCVLRPWRIRIPKYAKIIKGMRPVDAKISLKMYIVEYPVRVIPVAILVAVYRRMFL